MIFFLLNINNLSGSFNISTNEYQNIDFSLVPVFKFPDIWQNIAYLAGFLKILLGIYMVIAVTNEFQYGTIRLNLTNGLTRFEFLLSKFLVALIISLISAFILFSIGIFVGLFKNESGISQDMFTKLPFLGAYFLEILFYMTLALLLGSWLQKTGITIFILLVYPLLIEPLVRWQIPDTIDRYFPVKAMDNLNVFPFPKYFGMEVKEVVPLDSTLVTIGWIAMLFYLSYVLIQKKSL
jgi:ABC-type transport system involved in multi-copper enzyme maturation permease subunit